MAVFRSFGDYGPFSTSWKENIWKAFFGFDGTVNVQIDSNTAKTYIPGTGYYVIVKGTELEVRSGLTWKTLSSVTMVLDDGNITGALPTGSGRQQIMIEAAMAGDDTLHGSANDDIMIGGRGDDTFIRHFDPLARKFAGTPPMDFDGALGIGVTASDGRLSGSASFPLTVAPARGQSRAGRRCDAGAMTA